MWLGRKRRKIARWKKAVERLEEEQRSKNIKPVIYEPTKET